MMNQVEAGAAASVIMPPLGASLDGTISQNGPATDVHDELHARALVLDDGGARLAIVLCDATMISGEVLQAAKHRAHELTGIPTDRMLLAATHTHAAPRVIGLSDAAVDREYEEFLAIRTGDAIARANHQLAPARMAWGSVDKPEHVFNRRWRMKPGTVPPSPFFGGRDAVRMNPPRGSRELLEPAGPVDPELAFLSLESTEGQPIALLANYSLHYVGGTRRGEVSADYFGEFARRIAGLLDARRLDPPFVGVLSNGTSGDINNIDFRRAGERLPAYQKIRQVAGSLAEAVAEERRRLTHRGDVSLDMREKRLRLATRTPAADEVARARFVLSQRRGERRLTREEVYARETLAMADWPGEIETVVQALRIGDVAIAAMPCEVFAETGLAIKRESPFERTFTIELANDYRGYLPTPEQHALGGYETWRARSSYLETGAEPKLRAAVLQLLAELETNR